MPDDFDFTGEVSIAAPSRKARTPVDYRALYQDVGKKHGVDPDLLYNQAKQESVNFQDRYVYGPGKSPKGAAGISQFMPDTAREFGLYVGKGRDDRYNPQLAADAQARMMKKLLDQHGGDARLALAAYNSGHNQTSQQADRAARRIPETRGYVQKITGQKKTVPGLDFSGETDLQEPNGLNFSGEVDLGTPQPKGRFAAMADATANPVRNVPRRRQPRQGQVEASGLGAPARPPITRADVMRAEEAPRPGTGTYDNVDPRLAKGEQPRDPMAYAKAQELVGRTEPQREVGGIRAGATAMGPREQGIVERIGEAVDPYLRLDRPAGVKTDPLRGAASLGLLDLRREITPEEKLIDPDAEAAAETAYQVGSFAPAVVPYVGAAKAFSKIPALNAATREAHIARSALTFGGVELGRELARSAQIGEPLNPQEVAISTAIGSGIGGLAGVNPSLKRQVMAFITPGVVADVARGTDPETATFNAITNLFFGLHSGTAPRALQKPELRAALERKANATKTETASVEAQPAEPQRWSHRDFGTVAESGNQAGVGKGRVRVTSEDGSEHIIQRPKGTGAGNQIAIPVRETPPAEPAQPVTTPAESATSATTKPSLAEAAQSAKTPTASSPAYPPEAERGTMKPGISDAMRTADLAERQRGFQENGPDLANIQAMENLRRGAQPEINVRETPATLQAQVDERGFTFVPNENKRGARQPRGTRALRRPDGLVYYDPRRMTDTAYLRDTPIPELLGHVEKKSLATTEAVVARNLDGAEVQASAVSPENLSAQIAETQSRLPNTKVGVESPEKVVAERLASTTPRPESQVSPLLREDEAWFVPWADGRARGWFRTKEAADVFYREKRAENDVDGEPQIGQAPQGVKYADANYTSAPPQVSEAVKPPQPLVSREGAATKQPWEMTKDEAYKSGQFLDFSELTPMAKEAARRESIGTLTDGDKPASDRELGGYVFDPSGKFVSWHEHIDSAVASGAYEKAVKSGAMSARQAYDIIDGSGRDVPKDIQQQRLVEIVAQPSEPKTKTYQGDTVKIGDTVEYGMFSDSGKLVHVSPDGTIVKRANGELVSVGDSVRATAEARFPERAKSTTPAAEGGQKPPQGEPIEGTKRHPDSPVTTLPDVEGGPIDLKLPDFLKGTVRHSEAPELSIVQVVSAEGKPIRRMVFRGVNPETGDIGVSVGKDFGMAEHVTFVPREQVKPVGASTAPTPAAATLDNRTYTRGADGEWRRDSDGRRVAGIVKDRLNAQVSVPEVPTTPAAPEPTAVNPAKGGAQRSDAVTPPSPARAAEPAAPKAATPELQKYADQAVAVRQKLSPDLTKVEQAAIERKAARLEAKARGEELRRSGSDPYELIDDIIIRGGELIREGKSSFDEWSRKMRKEFGKDADPHLRRAWKSLRDESQLPETASVKNAATAELRADLGLLEMERPEKKSWETSIANAKAKELDKQAEAIADRVIEKGREEGLDLEESAAILIRTRELENQWEDLYRENPADPKLTEIKDQLDKFTQAVDVGGTEPARTLNFRRAHVDKEFRLISMIKQAEAAKGRKATAEEIARYDSVVKERDQAIKDRDAAIEQLSTKRLQKELDRASRQRNRAESKEKLDEEAAIIKQNIVAEFMRLKDKFASTSSMGGLGNLDPDGIITRNLLRYARNRARAEVGLRAEALIDEAHGLVKDFGVTRRQVAEAISGYNTKHADKRSEAAKRLADIRAEMTSMLQAEDVAAGVRTERAQGPRKSDVRKLPAAGPRLSEAPKYGPENAIKRNQRRFDELRRQEIEWERKFNERDFEPKKKESYPYNSDVRRAEDRVKIAEAKFRREMERARPGHWARNASGVWKSWLLSGAPTQAMNIAGTGSYQVFREAARLPAAIADVAWSAGRRATGLPAQRSIQGPAPTAMIESVIEGMGKKGIRDFAEIMRHGATAEQMKRHQFEEIDFATELAQTKDTPTRRAIDKATNSKAVKVIALAHNVVFRFMSASDRVFYQGAYRRNLIDRATMQAKNEGVSNVKERARKLMETDAEIQASADHDAFVATFNNDNALSTRIKRARAAVVNPHSLMSKKGALQLNAAENFALDLVLPFDRTPTNVIMRIIEASPAGYVKNAGQLAAAAWRKSMPLEHRRQFMQTFGNATAGSVLMYAGWALADKAIGMIEIDGYDVYLKIPGLPKINLRTASPPGNILASGARLRSIYDDPKSTKGDYAKTLLREPVNQPLLRATTGLSDLATDPDRSAGKFFGRMASGLVPFSGAVKWAGQLIDPAEKRYPDLSFKEQFQRNIPKWRESLPASRSRLLGPGPTKLIAEVERLKMQIDGVARQPDESPEDFTQRQAFVNPYIRRALEKVVAMPEYQNDSDENKLERLKQAKESAQAEGQAVWADEHEKAEKPEKPEYPRPSGQSRFRSPRSPFKSGSEAFRA